MPSRNTVKQYDTYTYYHVYNRGVAKQAIFIDKEDYAVFLSLLKRYLGEAPALDKKGREYEWLANDIVVAAFCLMPNHFHILVYQIELGAVTRLLRAVCGTYTVYFNKKYTRVGSLFQGIFKASMIRHDAYLVYISRYIHRNPALYWEWEWSSLPYWTGERVAGWIHPELLMDMTPKAYREFMSDNPDYEATHEAVEMLLSSRPGGDRAW